MERVLGNKVGNLSVKALSILTSCQFIMNQTVKYRGAFSRIDYEQSPFFLRDSRASETRASLPADVFWGSFVTHSFLPHGPWGRNECVTIEPQRTSAGRLNASVRENNPTQERRDAVGREKIKIYKNL